MKEDRRSTQGIEYSQLYIWCFTAIFAWLDSCALAGEVVFDDLLASLSRNQSIHEGDEDETAGEDVVADNAENLCFGSAYNIRFCFSR